jgi:hypothetical protein
MVIDGAINGDSFLAFVRHILVPTLRPGGIVIMDNPGGRRNVAQHAETQGHPEPLAPRWRSCPSRFVALRPGARMAGLSATVWGCPDQRGA